MKDRQDIEQSGDSLNCDKDLSLSEDCIVKAVVSYDFLHTNIIKPILIPKPLEKCSHPDPSFRGKYFYCLQLFLNI